MYRKIFIALIAIVLIALLFQFSQIHPPNKPQMTINGHVITVELADTDAKRTRGLSDRPRMSQNDGMLFIFPYKSLQSFWMKNMHFPLDIIWIDGNKIVGISANLPPERETPSRIYSSPQKVDKVLEINSGLATKWGLKVGDRAEMTNIN